ncbi:MAG TPA: hypothetical protein ENI44_04625, partial [Thermoplasmatales archaeon]|nr:hypothetical protein [Thermoplasmatales archaeon]
MKKRNKILIAALSAFIFLGGFASAEAISDPTGDVAHWRVTATSWGWEYNIGNKPEIDITELSYTLNGDKLTINLKVSGTIQNSELVGYWAYLNTSDANYWMYWSNGSGYGFAMSGNGYSGQFNQTSDIQATGDTISCTFTVVGTDYSNIDLWGYAAEYISPGDTFSEWWGDWIPNEHSPWWGEQNAGGGSSTNNDNTSGDEGAGGGNNEGT